MNKATKKRLQQVEEQFASVPIPPQVVKAAFAEFRSTGVLPEDLSVAYPVIQQARAGVECCFDDRDQLDLARMIRAAVESKPRVEDPLMDELYDEALFADGMVQEAARQTLRMFAAGGMDPTQPLFAGKDVEIPDWGGVGIHVLGLPERLVRPPYEQQAERLFERYELLRDRIPPGDRSWREQYGRVVGDFQERGELPADGLMRDIVLADAEIRALMQHACGEDVSEVMATLDAVAQASGAERDAAIVAVQDLFRRLAATPTE